MSLNSPEKEHQHSNNERQEQQKQLQERINTLKQLETDVLRSQKEHQEKLENTEHPSSETILPEVLLGDLEERIQRFSELDQLKYNQEVTKINEQLTELEKVFSQTLELKKRVLNSLSRSQKVQLLNKQLPGHDPVANQQRVLSAERIENIRPQEGDSAISNWAAKRIQNLIS